MNGGFTFTTPEELQSALRFLRERRATAYILDLRNNRGGQVYEAIRVADMFLQPDQVILSLKGRIAGINHTYTAANTNPDLSPLVVLINRHTASASEIVVGALQDHDRALIVGENSFGKGLVQSFIKLDEGLGLNLTIARYFTPSGRLIQRDYATMSYFDYFKKGKSEPDDDSDGEDRRTDLSRTLSRTDSGRPIYSKGGITPDRVAPPRVITSEQQLLLDSIFLFVRELVNGRIKGFNAYQVGQSIDFGHVLQPADFPVTEALYKDYAEFMTTRSALNITSFQLERERDFIKRQLRYEILTAAYGSNTALQALNDDDPQLISALEGIARARELTERAMRRANVRQ
jgi:carboxyl-terminal processing protease